MAAERSTKRKPTDGPAPSLSSDDPTAQWDRLTVPELWTIAADRGLSVGDEASKAEIVAALVAAGINTPPQVKQPPKSKCRHVVPPRDPHVLADWRSPTRFELQEIV